MSSEIWHVAARAGRYSAGAAAQDAYPMRWAVDRLIPASGVSVLFGTGSTGKTQLLLWLAMHVAAQGSERNLSWLGAKVHSAGRILVLSAEDLHEHLYKRIGDIARSMGRERGWTAEHIEHVCSRIHVLPFLSMAEEEFTEPNASLFQREPNGEWGPTPTLEAIEEFIADENKKADEEGRSEDRFVGVILDLAVSMAGFEMSQSEAAASFLFRLNRVSNREEMFWAVIGHTPKDAGKKAEEAAVERLRGSAMWSTTPRTVIELRCATANDAIDQVLSTIPGVSQRDVLFLSVAKANSPFADYRPRALVRLNDGTFEDITARFPSVFERSEKSPGRPAAIDRLMPTDQDETWLEVIDLVGRITNGGQAGERFSAQDVRDAFDREQPSIKALRYVAPDHDGKFSRKDYCLAWYLAKLKSFKAIQSNKDGDFQILDLEVARARFRSSSEPSKAVEAANDVRVSSSSEAAG